jgi:hypothetical protein
LWQVCPAPEKRPSPSRSRSTSSQKVRNTHTHFLSLTHALPSSDCLTTDVSSVASHTHTYSPHTHTNSLTHSLTHSLSFCLHRYLLTALNNVALKFNSQPLLPNATAISFILGEEKIYFSKDNLNSLAAASHKSSHIKNESNRLI